MTDVKNIQENKANEAPVEEVFYVDVFGLRHTAEEVREMKNRFPGVPLAQIYG